MLLKYYRRWIQLRNYVTKSDSEEIQAERNAFGRDFFDATLKKKLGASPKQFSFRSLPAIGVSSAVHDKIIAYVRKGISSRLFLFLICSWRLWR
jgi:hypothetical protein